LTLGETHSASPGLTSAPNPTGFAAGRRWCRRRCHVARPENLERDGRGIDRLQFVREIRAVRSARGSPQRSSPDSRRSVTPAMVSPDSGSACEIVDRDRRVSFERQFGDGLTDFAVVMHHLRHGQSLQTEIVTVLMAVSRIPWLVAARAKA
jgi:hypothetical protein